MCGGGGGGGGGGGEGREREWERKRSIRIHMNENLGCVTHFKLMQLAAVSFQGVMHTNVIRDIICSFVAYNYNLTRH